MVVKTKDGGQVDNEQEVFFFAPAGHHFLTGNGARAAFVIKTNEQLAGRFFRAFEVKALTKYPMRNFVIPEKKNLQKKVIPRDIRNQQDMSR